MKTADFFLQSRKRVHLNPTRPAQAQGLLHGTAVFSSV